MLPLRRRHPTKNSRMSVGGSAAAARLSSLRGTTGGCPSQTRSFGSCARCSRTRSLSDRVRRQDHRFATLEQIADSREVRVVPDLLPLLAADEALAPHVGRTIAQSRPGRDPGSALLARRAGASRLVRPLLVRRLAPACACGRFASGADVRDSMPSVIGLLASHANGFVRAAALELLAQHTSGREIPFISLRANDWVDPIAARASELLMSRLRPDNRPRRLGRAAIRCSRARTASARP